MAKNRENKKTPNFFGSAGNQPIDLDVSTNMMDTSWMAEGKCNEHPAPTFFPSDGVGVEIAKKICATCPALGQCLEYALDNRIDHGVWGGTSERGRRRILKARRQNVVALAGQSS